MLNINRLYESMAKLNSIFNDMNLEIAGIQASYDGMRREADEAFTESRRIWSEKESQAISATCGLSNEKKQKMQEMISGLESLEEQLCRVDKSYEKRRNGEFALLSSEDLFDHDSVDDYYSKLKEIHDEAISIARECSLTVKAQALQEIGMLFSSKRRDMYERLFLLLAESKKLKKLAEEKLSLSDSNVRSNWSAKKEAEIDRAAAETAEILQMIEEREQEDISNLIYRVNASLESVLSSGDVSVITELAGLLGDNNILPEECCEQIYIGELSLDLSGIRQYENVLDYINPYFAGHISGTNLVLPALFEIAQGMNFCFSSRGYSTPAKEAIHSIMFSLLKNQPASRQKFILSDPEGRSRGFDAYLDFLRQHPDVMGDKVLTTKDNIKDSLRELSRYVDEIGQTKFVGYHDIFEYNAEVVDKQESLKCLCLLDFPKYFDEEMLDCLYNIVRNGSEYGVQVLVHFNEDVLGERRSDSLIESISRIVTECIQLENVFGQWKFYNGVTLNLRPLPDRSFLRDFEELFAEQYKEITNTSLPIKKIIPRENWFEASSAEKLAIPIGKNEDGNLQELIFGQGTSHYALVIGSTGSGKSTLLHTIIMSALTTFSPDELNLYLMDFKSGTEFKVYAEKQIPHIKLLALDAMQEFGQSILDNLWAEMNRRSNLFNELISQGLNVKDIEDYRRLTGKKLPRILVVADEFQILFSEEDNRKIAAYCGGKLADFISLARVYGMHFLLATQTLSRLSSGFSIRKSTLNEMYVRIGLKCTESECNLLFGEKNGRTAFGKMGTEKGSAVYCEDYVQGKPVGFKVAYCDEATQEELLSEIEAHFSLLEPREKTKIFAGNSIPDIRDCKEFYEVDPEEAYSTVSILFGEPIRIASPVKLNVSRTKRSNLLIVGSEQRMIDQLVSLYMIGSVKTRPAKSLGVREESVYLFDGLHIIGENYSDCIGSVVHACRQDIKAADTNEDIISCIDDLYAIYEERRSARLSGNRKKYHAVHMIINNIQWIESINLILQNKSVSEFVVSKEAEKKVDKSDPFGFLNDSTSATLSLMDSFLTDMKQEKQERKANKNVSYNSKLLTLIESGYTYGINVVLSSPDFISIKEYMYGVVPKFGNRIVFSLNNADAGRVIPEAKTENLRNNIVIFYDGINPAYQFKPFAGIKEYVSKM
ncbi:MAG: FtsK/SpoIIIE domain-containing protein [Blautia sp.]|nr:FtsK/SpoIIIE domain-containing protein [Blautia sp.]